MADRAGYGYFIGWVAHRKDEFGPDIRADLALFSTTHAAQRYRETRCLRTTTRLLAAPYRLHDPALSRRDTNAGARVVADLRMGTRPNRLISLLFQRRPICPNKIEVIIFRIPVAAACRSPSLRGYAARTQEPRAEFRSWIK